MVWVYLCKVTYTSQIHADIFSANVKEIMLIKNIYI